MGNVLANNICFEKYGDERRRGYKKALAGEPMGVTWPGMPPSDDLALWSRKDWRHWRQVSHWFLKVNCRFNHESQ